MPPAKYAKDHPEYFCLFKGRRMATVKRGEKGVDHRNRIAAVYDDGYLGRVFDEGEVDLGKFLGAVPVRGKRRLGRLKARQQRPPLGRWRRGCCRGQDESQGEDCTICGYAIQTAVIDVKSRK